MNPSHVNIAACLSPLETAARLSCPIPGQRERRLEWSKRNQSLRLSQGRGDDVSSRMTGDEDENHEERVIEISEHDADGVGKGCHRSRQDADLHKATLATD